MANTSSCRGVAKLGNRFLTRISTTPSLRRGNHTSVYDKNVEDNVRPAIVPDGITETETFWGPNPNNGVFGPNNPINEERGFHTSPANGGSESVLEVKTFIRSLEDLEKHVHS